MATGPGRCSKRGWASSPERSGPLGDVEAPCDRGTRDEGVEQLFFKGGIECVVEPKGKGWKRIESDADGWTTVLERKARR